MLLPDGHDADQFRDLALNTFNIAYGASFGPYAKKYFRIGHLGDINDATLHRRAGGDRNVARAGRNPAQERRRAGGDGLHRLDAIAPGPRRGGVTLTITVAQHCRTLLSPAGEEGDATVP